MIEVKDLRIGNLVYQDYVNRQVFVSGFWEQSDECWYKYDDNEFRGPIQSFKGILLTEDWLIKFGFNEKYGGSYNRWLKRADNVNVFVKLIDSEDENGKLKGEFWYDCGTHVKYVHQLQNLFYALTGEELLINSVTNN